MPPDSLLTRQENRVLVVGQDRILTRERTGPQGPPGATGPTNIPEWTAGAYTHPTIRTDPDTNEIYRTLQAIADSTLTPANDPTNWELIGGSPFDGGDIATGLNILGQVANGYDNGADPPVPWQGPINISPASSVASFGPDIPLFTVGHHAGNQNAPLRIFYSGFLRAIVFVAADGSPVALSADGSQLQNVTVDLFRRQSYEFADDVLVDASDHDVAELAPGANPTDMLVRFHLGADGKPFRLLIHTLGYPVNVTLEVEDALAGALHLTGDAAFALDPWTDFYLEGWIAFVIDVNDVSMPRFYETTRKTYLVRD